ncbi:DUF924 family protein [Paracoccus aminophilus]|uniref:DUF924 domain-containing protein n=1 Tax=Paracoccus aminophilus JCM 7686 TaxID=1367847 RepID=S5YDS1_PARAH|nr:DUF924 family protein [Paracoccus aminophilus]AGT09593.1 hypothetical protein JCM7686_2525 [Paracoccus aminophilus JCM 7686]
MTPAEINAFWLDEIGEKGWYARSDAVDATIRDRFQPAWEDAENLTRDWLGAPRDALAALILTDQFPRNMFRDDPRAFATDALALRIADAAINLGHDLAIPLPARQFFYLPFEHSESLSDQNRAVELIREFMGEESTRHAELHRDAIRAFGRFPWRNGALGRTNTPDEQRLLDAGGYGALVSGKVSLDAAGKLV